MRNYFSLVNDPIAVDPYYFFFLIPNLFGIFEEVHEIVNFSVFSHCHSWSFIVT